MNKDIMGRYNAFWAREDIGKPILSIMVKDATAAWEKHSPQNPHDQWINLDARYEWSRFNMINTKYYGEAVPTDWVNFGPGCLAAMMGSNFVIDKNTIWFGFKDYFLKDWSNLDDLHLVTNSPMYEMVRDMTQILIDSNDGSYTVGISDLGGNLDVLASLRNTEDLLTDLYDEPDMVLRAVEIIDKAWIEYFTLLRDMIRKSGQVGHTTWLGLWCETSYFPLQCDFAAMISPKDFERFVIPSLRRIADFLDHSIYHLDGQNQISHLDHLLSLDRLDGIQWVPGDGNPQGWDEKWFPMYEKIQAAGKCLVLHGPHTVEQVLKICRNLSPKGLSVHAWLETEAEAEELLARI